MLCRLLALPVGLSFIVGIVLICFGAGYTIDRLFKLNAPDVVSKTILGAFSMVVPYILYEIGLDLFKVWGWCK